MSLEVVCCCDKMRETSFGFTVAHHDREITSAGALSSWFQSIHGQEEEGGEHCAQLASSTVQAPSTDNGFTHRGYVFLPQLIPK